MTTNVFSQDQRWSGQKPSISATLGVRILHLAVAALLLAGCGTVTRPDFGADEQAQAQPVGFSDVRFDADNLSQTAAFNKRFLSNLPDMTVNGLQILVLSGGGADGAYGAGFLQGWTHSGKRPSFAIVTGISAGALIAPFAFLGAEWDDRLQAAFIDGRSAKLLRRRSGLGVLFSGGIYEAEPLRRLVESYVDNQLIVDIAKENAKGRRLLVATTDLDTQRSVVWDLGAIASRGGPAARALFIDVLVASASVPGVFPPQLIAVEDGHGHHFQEMHVDGGTSEAFFGIPESLLLMKAPQTQNNNIHMYVLLNTVAKPSFAVTKTDTLGVAARAFDTMMKSSTRTLVSVTKVFCLRNNLSCLFAAVPPGAGSEDFLDFSTSNATKLFQLGQADGLAGTGWQASP